MKEVDLVQLYRARRREKRQEENKWKEFLFLFIYLFSFAGFLAGMLQQRESITAVPWRPDHNTGNSVPYSLLIVCVFFNVPQLFYDKGCDTGPPAYSPYPKRLESLTICWCNYKGLYLPLSHPPRFIRLLKLFHFNLVWSSICFVSKPYSWIIRVWIHRKLRKNNIEL